jgi:hypothetical protein
MIGATHRCIRENCLSQDDSVLVLPSTTTACLSYFEQSLNMENQESQNQWLDSTTDLLLNSLQNNLSEFKLNVLNHVAGFIQKQLKAREQCSSCNVFLSNMKIVHGGKLLNRKNRGGLTLPSEEFEKIVKISETLFQNILVEAGGNPFRIKNIVDIISLKACSLIQELYPALLEELDNHLGIMGSHRNLMIKKVVGSFIALRMKHFCKQFNNESIKVRVQLSKLILFKHQ